MHAQNNYSLTKRSFSLRTWTLFTLIVGMLTSHINGEDSETSFNSVLAYDSKYISEGRDNLDEGGIGSVAFEWATATEGNGEAAFSGWYAEGIDADYSELNLGVSYGWSLEKFDVGVGYTWLDFAEDDKTHNEFALELGTSIHDDYDVGAAFTYSTEAGGTWINLEISKEFANDKFAWSPYLLLGINSGYVADEHDGINNLQMGLHVATELSDGFELGGYVAYTIGLDEEPGESLDDIFWVGIGLGWGN